MNKPKVSVIGTINKDSVVLSDGTTYQGYGGIFYNLIVLSKLLEGRAVIYPVCNIGADCYNDIVKILKAMPSIRLDFINRVSQKNNHCHLSYIDESEKKEILTGGVPPLKYENLTGIIDSDIVLLNYISGRDIYMNSLKKLRINFRGKIYIDIHSYTLGHSKAGGRYLRRLPGWINLIKAGDMIQMNRIELALLAGYISNPDMEIRDSMESFFDSLNSNNIDCSNKCFLVTDGDKGSYLIKKSASELLVEEYMVKQNNISGDTTGCGDCFGAGFVAAQILGKSESQSMILANRAASDRIRGKYNIPLV